MGDGFEVDLCVALVYCRAARRSSPRTLAEEAFRTITATQRRFKLGS
jgi:hypothetical protein